MVSRGKFQGLMIFLIRAFDAFQEIVIKSWWNLTKQMIVLFEQYGSNGKE